MDVRWIFFHVKILLLLTWTLMPSSAADSSSELRFLFLVFNTGLRSPLRTFPKDPHQENAWPQGFGQLTQKGVEKQHELGQFLRERYHGYLNELYFAPEIYVQSLDIDRSLMSASALLSGLFPPLEWQIWDPDILWQPIPIHTKPADKDPFLAPCPVLDMMWNETFNGTEIQNFLDRYSVYRVAMEQLIGANISNVFELEYVFDALSCAKENDMTIPNWPSNLFGLFTNEIYPFLQKSYFNQTGAKQLISGPYVNEVVKFFTLRMQELLDSRLKAYFLSADDRIIKSLLNGFDVYNFARVPFSTAVMLELRHGNDLGYFVNILLKNSTEEEEFYLTIPGCEKDCPIDLFLNLTQDVIPENWSLECYKFQGITFVKIARSVLIVTVSVVTSLVVLVCCFAVCCHKKLRKRNSKNYATTHTERTNAFPEEMPMMSASAASSDLDD